MEKTGTSTAVKEVETGEDRMIFFKEGRGGGGGGGGGWD